MIETPNERSVLARWLAACRLQYTSDCFADISTREACTVTQKLDLDQMSDELKEHVYTEVHTYEKTHFLLQILGLFGFI